MNNPELKFHINPDAASSGSPLSYMGQSWSKPNIAWVNWNGSRKMVMFVGGGYDAGGATGTANNAGYESDTYNQTNGVGAGVYMFDALNGDLLWWASNNASATSAATTTSGVIALKDPNLKYSVVSEIKTADRDNDGLVDHLYFGDLSGQVFRIDLNNKASTIGAFGTRSTRILNMHNASSAYLSPRFYSAPSFAIFKDSESGDLFAAISIGSGNLSHPLAGYDSGRSYDALYTIYDKDVARSDLYTTTSLHTQDTSVGNSNSMLAINELTLSNRFQQSAEAMSALVAPYASSSGWYYQMQGGTKIQNEKIFYSPTVIDYDLYVSSYDSSRLGLTGACGGGVQGVSKVQLFCMPFGQCSAADYPDRTDQNYSDEHGPGIQNHAIASGGDGTTRLVGGAIIGNNLDDQYKTKIKLIAQRWYEK
jgi:type IV pilus assembly protein PilY1